jgi:hypothetical protein
MIRDILRAALVLAVLAVGTSLVVEARWQLAMIDAAHRGLVASHAAPPQWQPMPTPAHAAPATPPEAPLRRLGRAALDMADAALGVVR